MHGACHTGESTRPPYWAAGSSERPRGQRWEGGGRQQEPSPTGDGSQGKSLPRHVTRDQAGLLDGRLSGAQEGGGAVWTQRRGTLQNIEICTLHKPPPKLGFSENNEESVNNNL